ncbi:hypothetical protein FisN_7Lh036 [Fistulifera solaris]|uniref:Protein Mpv17 n=1 Tax=Fistulifera solaris TaxID=1519565 RepID=A0A1Z5JCD9_FISSO|nr:hypothetical protein FisN_7Lh036 [Fistulifera solaris]|eukprot:GAX11670.1 hypothetical protein FisN_7Lh036 [Fistulifera solaris]
MRQYRFLALLVTLVHCTLTRAFSSFPSSTPHRRISIQRFADSKSSFLERFSLSSKTPSTEKDETFVSTSQLQSTTKAPSSPSPYVQFAQTYPFANNILIATTKTAAADFLAQVVIAQTPVAELDLQRSFLFCLFGALYLGGFQYLYQVQIFKKIFDVDRFTQQTWQEKLQDKEGLQALVAQTALDLTVLTLIYLPAFYIFKASVFSGSSVPAEWVASGIDTYQTNFVKDETDLIRVWLPADLVCFSVPLYLRLPVRHIVSFVWTAYLSFARGGH